MQASLELDQGAVAQQQAPGAHGRVVHDDLVGGVESAEFAGEFVEMEAEKMRPQGVGGQLHGIGEFHELAGEGHFLRGFGRRGGNCHRNGGVAGAGDRWIISVESGLPEDRADARDRIEQVGGGVALQ